MVQGFPKKSGIKYFFHSSPQNQPAKEQAWDYQSAMTSSSKEIGEILLSTLNLVSGRNLKSNYRLLKNIRMLNDKFLVINN